MYIELDAFDLIREDFGLPKGKELYVIWGRQAKIFFPRSERALEEMVLEKACPERQSNTFQAGKRLASFIQENLSPKLQGEDPAIYVFPSGLVSRKELAALTRGLEEALRADDTQEVDVLPADPAIYLTSGEGLEILAEFDFPRVRLSGWEEGLCVRKRDFYLKREEQGSILQELERFRDRLPSHLRGKSPRVIFHHWREEANSEWLVRRAHFPCRASAGEKETEAGLKAWFDKERPRVIRPYSEFKPLPQRTDTLEAVRVYLDGGEAEEALATLYWMHQSGWEAEALSALAQLIYEGCWSRTYPLFPLLSGLRREAFHLALALSRRAAQGGRPDCLDRHAFLLYEYSWGCGERQRSVLASEALRLAQKAWESDPDGFFWRWINVNECLERYDRFFDLLPQARERLKGLSGWERRGRRRWLKFTELLIRSTLFGAGKGEDDDLEVEFLPALPADRPAGSSREPLTTSLLFRLAQKGSSQAHLALSRGYASGELVLDLPEGLLQAFPSFYQIALPALVSLHRYLSEILSQEGSDLNDPGIQLSFFPHAQDEGGFFAKGF
jgi:hypothetical protein